MARTSNNNSDPDLRYNVSALPPWERGTVVQVPYLDASARSLSSTERDALPSLWAAQARTVSGSTGQADSHMRYRSTSSQRRDRSSDDCIDFEGRKALLTTRSPRLCDAPQYVAPGPKSTPCPPTYLKPPPTPPDSDLGSCGTASTTDSPPSRSEEKPLPTVPSYVESHCSSPPRKPSSTQESHRPGSRLQRWKSAFKEMFTHRPVDESDLVHISAHRHWTED